MSATHDHAGGAHDHGSGGHDHDDHDHGAGDHDDHDDRGHGHARHRHEHEHAGHGGHGGHGHEHAGGFRGFVRGIFAPHSHDAADSVDRALRDSEKGIRALKISLAALAVTAILQVGVVIISGSVALLADTVHNFADALTAIPLGFAFWLSRRPATKRYTYGYGRAEDLAGIFIVAMIALSAGVAAWESVRRLFDPQDVRNVGWVMAAGVIGFAGNELVAMYRIRVGREIGSAALVADGLHARTDGLTSLAVVAGAAGVAAGWQLADPIVGLLITVAILFVLKQAARDIYRRLMDSVDPELVDQVAGVAAAVAGVQGVERVAIRWVGHELLAEVEVVSDCDLTLAASHEIAEEVHHRLLHDIPKLARATIHTSPCDHDGRDHHRATSHHFAPG
jgi:cation diffusion facilitator family transporter